MITAQLDEDYDYVLVSRV